MRIIELTQGKQAIICACHYEKVVPYKWTYSHGYAYRKHKVGNKWVNQYLHQVINNTPKGWFTDHINQNKLDNRCENLRTVNKRINTHNQGPRKDNKSGVKGVYWNKRRKKWVTYAKLGDKQHYIGQYNTKEEAGIAYKEKTRVYYQYEMLRAGRFI